MDVAWLGNGPRAMGKTIGKSIGEDMNVKIWEKQWKTMD
jgi:hypothetical protein